MKGTVKWYNDSKGFGFIDGEDGETYYMSKTSIRGGSLEIKACREDIADIVVNFEPIHRDGKNVAVEVEREY